VPVCTHNLTKIRATNGYGKPALHPQKCKTMTDSNADLGGKYVYISQLRRSCISKVLFVAFPELGSLFSLAPIGESWVSSN
jgi:hypothetical protein